jgi:hypothetical protein
MYITYMPKAKKMVGEIDWGHGNAEQAKFQTRRPTPEACSSCRLSKMRLATVRTFWAGLGCVGMSLVGNTS